MYSSWTSTRSFLHEIQRFLKHYIGNEKIDQSENGDRTACLTQHVQDLLPVVFLSSISDPSEYPYPSLPRTLIGLHCLLGTRNSTTALD